MNVPNWLIALELASGAALLYISSSALINTDMHLANRNTKPVERELHSSLHLNSGEPLVLTANTPQPVSPQ